MKIIKYNVCTKVNHGSQKYPEIEEVLSRVAMSWTEANEQIAKSEAYMGEYYIEEDEIAVLTQEQRIGELEEALNMLLSGVTE